MPYQGSGREILAQVRKDIARAGVVMNLTAGQDHLPMEHRTRVRAEQTQAARSALAEGRQAIAAWAAAEEERARRVLASDKVGSPQEETRRNTNEVRVSRIVADARAAGSPRTTAHELAAAAERAYSVGSLDDADTMARAAAALQPGIKAAEDTLRLVKYDRDSQDPEKLKAMRALGDIRATLGIFDRDVSGTYSEAIRESAALANALGRPGEAAALSREVAQASVASKIAAAVIAREDKVKYESPLGALPEGPTGQPGGHLPEPR